MLCYHGGRVVIFLNETTPPSSCCVSVPGWSGIDCNVTIARPPRGLSPVDSHRLATPWWATPVMSKQHLLFLCTTDVHQLLFSDPNTVFNPFFANKLPFIHRLIIWSTHAILQLPHGKWFFSSYLLLSVLPLMSTTAYAYTLSLLGVVPASQTINRLKVIFGMYINFQYFSPYSL